ncbi:M56 family metallopeptidase [Lachnospiraceae bacterium 29-84]
MVVSHSSILICLVSSSFLILLTWLVLRKGALMGYIGKYVWIVFLCIAVRMLVPVEFRFTISVYSRYVMTRFQNLMNFRFGIGGDRVAVSQIILHIWMAGAMVRFLLQMAKYSMFSYMARKYPAYAGFAGQDVDGIVHDINKEHGRGTAFEIKLVPWMETPAVFGVVRPRILMPAIRYTEDELYYVLKHEMLHYYHHDILVKLLYEIFTSIYWWNPGVYWLKKQVTQVIEFKTDASLASGLDRQGVTEYMMCIVKTLKEKPKVKLGALSSFLGLKQGSLAQRFYFMEDNSWNGKRSHGVLVAVVSVVLLFLSFLFIFEPAYKVSTPRSYDCPTPETSYLVGGDGCFEVYQDGEYIGYVLKITDVLTELKVYRHMEEGANEKFMQKDYGYTWAFLILIFRYAIPGFRNAILYVRGFVCGRSRRR